MMSLNDYYHNYPNTIDSSSLSLYESNDINDNEMNEIIPLNSGINISDSSNSSSASSITFGVEYFQDCRNSNDNIRNKNDIKEIGLLEDELKWLVLNDFRFPLCMLDKLERLSKKEVSNASKRQWFVVIMMALQNSLHYGTEASLIQWYTVYIEDKFSDATIIISTTQLSTVALFLVLGMQFMTKLGEKLKELQVKWNKSGNERLFHVTMNYNITNVFVMVIFFGDIGLMFLMFVIFPAVENVYVFWVFLPFLGFIWGVVAMVQEMILLEMQPKHLTGRVAGIKNFAKMFSILYNLYTLYIQIIHITDFGFEISFLLQRVQLAKKRM